MAGFFLRGALLEYGTDVLGPIPNIVVFQFNPEEISRTLNIRGNEPAQPEADQRQRERAQTGAPPVESFEITAHFSAADDLGKGGAAAAIRRHRRRRRRSRRCARRGPGCVDAATP